jgi:hypothetical protein
MRFEDIAAALAACGLRARGGFHPEHGDAVPEVRPGVAARTVVVIGNTGSADWQAFAAAPPPGSDPLDQWTRCRVQALAPQWGARDVYPCDQPFLPFQRWARRAEDVHASPLGLLIHPEFGLWHAYRAALLLPAAIAVPARGGRTSPCDACAAKPCLGACPAGSFGADGFDSRSCHAHLDTREGGACLDLGCQARNACPIGRKHRYLPDQIRFHMRAYHDTPP